MTSVTKSYSFPEINAVLKTICEKDTYKDHQDLTTNPVYFDVIQKAFEALSNDINRDETGCALNFRLLKKAVDKQKLAVLFLDVNFSDDKTGKRYFELRKLAMENVRFLKAYKSYTSNGTTENESIERSNDVEYDKQILETNELLQKIARLRPSENELFVKLYDEAIKSLEREMLLGNFSDSTLYGQDYYKHLSRGFGYLVDTFYDRVLGPGCFIPDGLKELEKVRPAVDQRMHLLFLGFKHNDIYCKEQLRNLSRYFKSLKEDDDDEDDSFNKARVLKMASLLLYKSYIDKILALKFEDEE